MNLMSGPGDSTVSRKAEKLNKELFNHGQYYYHLEDIIKLLNHLSGYSDAPNEHNLLWGDCIATCIAIKDMIRKLGVRGSNILQIVKQCVVACMLDMKDDKIMNKELISEMLPHEDVQCKRDWIQKCVDRKEMFELFDEPDFFVDAPESNRTPSYVHIVSDINSSYIPYYLARVTC